MGDKVLVGLLSSYLAPFRSYECADIRNVELIIFTERTIDWTSQLVQGFVWNGVNWSRDWRPLPRGIYNRLYQNCKPQVVTRLESIIGPNKVFNHVTQFDKGQVYQILKASPLAAYLPQTERYHKDRFLPFLDKHEQVILKPALGRLGNQIYKIEKTGGKFSIYLNTRYPRATLPTEKHLVDELAKITTSSFLMQQYIPMKRIEGRIFDLRFLVQKNGGGSWIISGSLSRHALNYAYVTNILQRITSAEETIRQSGLGGRLLRDLSDLSKSVATILEKSLGSLGEISVDLGIDEAGHPWIIEVNGKPAKEMFADLQDTQLWQQVYETPIAYAKYLATK